MEYSNVFIDANCKFNFDTYYESGYLKAIFSYLNTHFGSEFDQFNFYVFSCNEPSPRPASISDPAANKVLIFLGDEHAFFPTHLAPFYTAIFKNYLPFEQEEGNVFSFPLGYAADVPLLPVKPMSERPFSVFFSGCLNLNRLKLYKELTWMRIFPYFILFLFRRIAFLNRLTDKLFVLDVSGKIEGSYLKFTRYFGQKNIGGIDYATMLNDSKIVLCPKGFFSSETFRYFEAVRQGAVVITEELPGTFFYKKTPVIQVKNWRAGLLKAKELLSNPDELEMIATKTREYWDEELSERAVGLFMIERLRRISEIKN